MDFTAIDFETATRRPDSACQLAAVRVRGGQIIDSAMWMIRPRPFHFSAGNIAIHGIRPDDVRDAPEFGDLWPEIGTFLGQDCLIAHYATFDMGVLLACLITHGCDVPEMHYSCSCAIARRAWPDRPRFGLKPLADGLGITFRHHDALEDSTACAKIAIAAARHCHCDTLEDLERDLKLARGRAGAWGKRSPSVARRSRSTPSTKPTLNAEPPSEVLVNEAGIDLQRLSVRAEFIRPLAGRVVSFTGAFHRITLQDAQRLADCCGGLSHVDQATAADVVLNESALLELLGMES